MLDHHIQRTIVTTLRTADKLSFTELRPGDIDNKLFTYHLKIVIREGFMQKTDDGLYRLTPAGEKLWKRMSEKPETIALRPFSVLFLLIKRQDDGWLLYRRKSHPVKDRVAFMHCIPEGDRPVTETATRQALIATGLECEFAVIGSGFFHTYTGDTLDGFTNFTLLACEDARGELVVSDEYADYFWDASPDFDGPDMLPNMPYLVEAYQAGNFPFFIDQVVKLS